MQDSTSNFLAQIALAMAPMVVALLGWAAKKAADYVNAHVKNTLLSGVLTRLDFAVLNAVQAVEQSTVAAMRNEDGSLAPNAAQAAKAAAIAAAKSYLGSKGWQEILSVLGLTSGDGESMLATHIEAAVMKMQMKQAASAPQTTVAAVANGAAMVASSKPAAVANPT